MSDLYFFIGIILVGKYTYWIRILHPFPVWEFLNELIKKIEIAINCVLLWNRKLRNESFLNLYLRPQDTLENFVENTNISFILDFSASLIFRPLRLQVLFKLIIKWIFSRVLQNGCGKNELLSVFGGCENFFLFRLSKKNLDRNGDLKVDFTINY